MKIYTLLLASIFCAAGVAPTLANSEFDIQAKIYKRPATGIVNVRKFASPSSQVVGQVTNGHRVMITGGTCINAKTGAEVDITGFKTKMSLYRKLKSPNLFCMVTSNDIDGWVRGTHLMPSYGFE